MQLNDPTQPSIDPRRVIDEQGLQSLAAMLIGARYRPQPRMLRDLKHSLRSGKPWLIEGPRGGGKTALAEAIALACNLATFYLQGTEELTLADVLYSWDREEQREMVEEERRTGTPRYERQAKKYSREFLILGEALGAFDYASRSHVPPILICDEVEDFHQRRRVRIRYRPWGWTVNLPPPMPGQPPPQPTPAPTDAQCESALRGVGSLLPIPDPEIVRLSGAAYDAGTNSTITEALWFEKTLQFVADVKAGKNPKLEDEIWLAVGAAGTGGYALPDPAPTWTATTDATARTTAHEIGHLFQQNHLMLCGTTGDNPASFPNNGNVGVTGWDMWNNAVVRGATDIMMRTYCPEPTWISPERWRRIFLKVGS